jgi:hypothetical protein
LAAGRGLPARLAGGGAWPAAVAVALVEQQLAVFAAAALAPLVLRPLYRRKLPAIHSAFSLPPSPVPARSDSTSCMCE